MQINDVLCDRTNPNNLLMVFNGLLITFGIRNIIQWAYLFIRTPVKKLQPIVSSILGHVYSIDYSFMFTLLRVLKVE